MKIKSDFVTNSSSTSFILQSEAKFKTGKEEETISRYGENLKTLDMIKMIEGELQYNKKYKKIKLPLIIQYSQKVYDTPGDGWDGGDYNFAGLGFIFLGQTDILEMVMTKNLSLTFDGNKIEFPISWVEEFDQKYIEKHYKKFIKDYNNGVD